MPAHVLFILGALNGVAGLLLLAGGMQLVALGGSIYYLFAGGALLTSGVLIARRRVLGAWVYFTFVGVTIGWSLWEVGLEPWLLVPRLAMPLLFSIVMFLCIPALLGDTSRSRRRLATAAATILGLIVAGMCGWALIPSHLAAPGLEESAASSFGSENQETDWRHYGRTEGGTRFSPAAQITPQNVQQLKVAWVYRMGNPLRSGTQQSTPVQIGNSLYLCNGRSEVIALDADSGKQVWRFDPHASSAPLERCRGVGYYEVARSSSDDDFCQRRVLASTIDARLIALNAETGTPCREFGREGTVDLKAGLGATEPGDYYQTSAPTVVRDLVVVGGRVEDGRRMGMPGGIVRAFKATTGELVWVWDPANPAITQMPPPGSAYSRGGPNMWSTPSYDDRLGLLYVPLGAPTGANDFWGGWRSESVEKYANAIVALDVTTGQPRWSFQTVHHDVWDYDLGSQPTLFDVPNGDGGTVPALIQATKRGEIFLLDRRDGSPLAQVKEKAVPLDGQSDDWLSPTQPYSVGMPSIGADRLSEMRMWGITALDQLWCRIQFKRMRYEGQFTPPTTTQTLIYPGWYGGMNWGGVSVDEQRGYLIVNDTRVPIVVSLLPPVRARHLTDRGSGMEVLSGAHASQEATSADTYRASVNMFTSPLGIPCNPPPWGTLTAIDLNSRKIVWQVPMGTTRDTGPLGVKLGVPIPIGLPTLGGTLATKSRLIFFAGTQDFYLRAIDIHTGEERWKARLPVGAQATPMTYVSKRSGRQFVVVVAGGAPLSKEMGDYVIAYALPPNLDQPQ